MSLFIKDILYVPMTGVFEIKRGSIRIDGQRITEIGDLSPQWGDEIIYGHDKLALPGLVNGHCHAAMTMLRGYGGDLPLNRWLQQVQSAEAALNSEDIYWGTLLAHMEMLKAGITCYGDMYFDEGASVWAMEESGIRARLGNGLVDNDGKGDVHLHSMLRLIDGCKDDLQGRLTFALAPHAVYSCSGEFLRAVSEEACRRDLPIHIHIAETAVEQSSCIEHTGKRVIPYLNDLGILDSKVFAAHMIHLDAEEFALVQAKDLRVIHCPQSNMKLASGVFPYDAFAQQRAVIGIGTDGPASNNDLDLFEEMRSAVLLQKVATNNAAALPCEEALAMMTINGARALFLDHEIGTLEPGKKADITILSLWRPHFYPRNEENQLLNHLIFNAKAGDVHTVIVNGKICLRGGQCVSLDESRIYHEVQRRSKKFWQRFHG